MVLLASAMPAIPATVTPMPACASAAPYTDSRCCASRVNDAPRGMRNSRARSTTSAALPAISHALAAKPSAGIPRPIPSVTRTPTTAAIKAAHQSRSSAGPSEARFHGITGPTAIAISKGAASGSTVA